MVCPRRSVKTIDGSRTVYRNRPDFEAPASSGGGMSGWWQKVYYDSLESNVEEVVERPEIVKRLDSSGMLFANTLIKSDTVPSCQ